MTATRTIIGNMGDAVILADGVDRSTGLRPGDRAEIVGFELTSYGRTHNHGLPPGIYQNPAYPIVMAAGGNAVTVGAHLLAPEPGREQPVVGRSSLRLTDLPPSDFYEMDIVQVPGGGKAVVTRVDYLALALAPGSHPKAILCEFAEGGGADFGPDDLVLVSRGNVWRREHGEPVAFETAREEGAFHRAVGEYEEARCPSTGNFAWPRDEAIEALVAGDVHGSHADEFPQNGTGLHMIRFRDEAVGEAVRLDTLQGLEISHPVPGR